jgi:hypothetical protein
LLILFGGKAAYGRYLFPVVVRLEDVQVAVMRHVSPIMREHGTPTVRAALVMVLKDLSIG